MASTAENESAAAILTALRVHGPQRAGVLRERVGLPRVSFARAIDQIRDQLVLSGNTTSLTYAARREISGLPPTLPLYELAVGGSVHFATLHPVFPNGFFVEGPSTVSVRTALRASPSDETG